MELPGGGLMITDLFLTGVAAFSMLVPPYFILK